MAKFEITKDSVTQSTEKTYLEVTFIDEINGKPSVTSKHEIESLDEAVINEQLTLSALEYESRVEAVQTPKTIVTGVEVKAEVMEVSELPIDQVI